MKININQITAEVLTLEENITPQELDLDTDIIKCRGPVNIKADLSRLTNVVTADLTLNASIYATCSRCLNEFEVDLKKALKLIYPVKTLEPILELNKDIREEIILEYPIRPLCRQDCRGLCPKCGKNLNKGGCSCGTT